MFSVGYSAINLKGKEEPVTLNAETPSIPFEAVITESTFPSEYAGTECLRSHDGWLRAPSVGYSPTASYRVYEGESPSAGSAIKADELHTGCSGYSL